MSVGTPIPQYDKTETIPENSTYIVDMGDGSGTKGVTQKVLTEEVGKALKIGNAEELRTEDKTSIVAAINEAAKSGGDGASVDILDSKEEIEANTEQGKVAGAQAVKEMFGEINSNLGGCSLLTKEDGAYIKYTLPGGADPVVKKLDSANLSEIAVSIVYGKYTASERCIAACCASAMSYQGIMRANINSDGTVLVPNNGQQNGNGFITKASVYLLEVGQSVTIDTYWGNGVIFVITLPN